MRHILTVGGLQSLGAPSNTGDATVADVAAGKIFSSSLLTNVTGESTKNATVSVDAPIQPPQAFVDHIFKFVGNDELHINEAGLTYIDANPSGILDKLTTLQPDNIGAVVCDLSLNSLPSSVINGILALFVLQGGSNGFLDLSGQTPPAAPTGQGLIDKAALITAGFEVTTD